MANGDIYKKISGVWTLQGNLQGPAGATGPPGGALTAADIQNSTYVYGIDTGAANIYTANLSPAVTAYVAGLALWLVIAHTNTAASTLSLNGLSNKAIKKISNGVIVDVIAGDLLAGSAVLLIYTGTYFQISSGGGGGNVTAQYVLGASDALLTNAKVIPAFQYSPFAKPASPTADDDEFEGSALAGGWSTVSAAGGATFTVSNSRLQIMRPAGVQVMALAIKARPTAPYEFVVEGSFQGSSTRYHGGMVGMRDSATGKMVLMNYIWSGTDVSNSSSNNVDYWNSVGPSGYAGTTMANNPRVNSPGRWFLKWADTGTNFVFSFSLDGLIFVPSGSGSRTAFLASSYDQIAIGAYADNNSPIAYVSFDYIRRTI